MKSVSFSIQDLQQQQQQIEQHTNGFGLPEPLKTILPISNFSLPIQMQQAFPFG